MERIKGLQVQIAELLDRAGEIDNFRRGCVTMRFRRCGKKNCICAQPDHGGHGPQYMYVYHEDGKTRSRSLAPGTDLQTTQMQVANYRIFTGIIKRIVDLNVKICEISAEDSVRNRAHRRTRNPLALAASAIAPVKA